ncbi:MAG: hypothetical protein MR497_01995 [Bacilli bacterium]|nr:hypothetical protein [Bacilli bacterium]
MISFSLEVTISSSFSTTASEITGSSYSSLVSSFSSSNCSSTGSSFFSSTRGVSLTSSFSSSLTKAGHGSGKMMPFSLSSNGETISCFSSLRSSIESSSSSALLVSS